MKKDVRQIERKALGQYPEAFEESTLLILHQAFLETARIMSEISPDGKNYWEILHAAEELLSAMGHIENAAFEWRSYTEQLDLLGEKEHKEERREKKEKISPIQQGDGVRTLCSTCGKLYTYTFPNITVVSPEMEKMVYALHNHLDFCRCHKK